MRRTSHWYKLKPVGDRIYTSMGVNHGPNPMRVVKIGTASTVLFEHRHSQTSTTNADVIMRRATVSVRTNQLNAIHFRPLPMTIKPFYQNILDTANSNCNGFVYATSSFGHMTVSHDQDVTQIHLTKPGRRFWHSCGPDNRQSLTNPCIKHTNQS